MICPSCGLGNSIMLALQEALMKDWVGHAGMRLGCIMDLGASFLNFSIWKWERESTISLHTPETWVTHTLISHLLAQKYNKQTKPMVWGAWVEPLSQISTTAWLSQWNRIFWQAQIEPQVWTARTIAYISFQVISMSFVTVTSGTESTDHPSMHPTRTLQMHECTGKLLAMVSICYWE